MRYIYIYICLFICKVHFAQNENLVHNPSFEDTIQCPNFYTDFYYWTSPSNGSPDAGYCCSCTPQQMYDAFMQHPHTGKIMAGIITYEPNPINGYREYVQGKLKKTLVQNKKYCFSFYHNISDIAYYNCNNLGVYFSLIQQNINTNQELSFIPQISNNPSNSIADSANWLKLKGVYIANGNEEYLIIGNFDNNANSTVSIFNPNFPSNSLAYFYIDDVSLHEMNINAGNDIIVCDTSSSFLTIGELNLDTTFKAYYWYDENNNLIDSTSSTIIVNPKASTSYVLKKELCETLYDTVNITVLNCKGEEIYFEVPNVFTPNGDGINDNLEIKIGNADLEIFEIYNRWGNLILKSETNNLTTKTITWSGRTTSGIECSDGVYYYVIKAKDKDGKDLNQKGFITLVK